MDKKQISHRRSDTFVATMFLLPNIIGFVIFTAIPVVFSLIISFFDWPLIGNAKFIGLSNYVSLFSTDPLFGKVMINTFKYVILYVTFNIIIAMAIAIWLTSKIKFAQFYRLR